MKDQRKTEIKVGITVLVGLVILIFVFSWAKNLSLNSNKKIITIDFDSVAGLETGDPVTINGVRKGYVDNIAVKASDVEVTVSLEKDVILFDDAQFFVMMLDLMGGKKVEIKPGYSQKELDYSTPQKGELLGDIASAMAVLGNMQKDIVDVVKEIKTTLSYLNKNLADEDFNNDLKTSVNNLSKLTNNLNILINQNKEDFNKLLDNSVELTGSVNEFLETNKGTLNYTIASLGKTLDETHQLIARVNDLMMKTEKGENNLGKILNDPELAEDVKASIQQLKDLTKLLLEQMESKGIKVDAKIRLF